MATPLERLLLELRLRYVDRSRIRRRRGGGLVMPKQMAPRAVATRYVGIMNQYQEEVNDLVRAEVELLIGSLFATRQDDAQTDATEGTFESLEEKVLGFIGSGLFETSVAAVAFDVLAFSDDNYDRGVYKIIGFNNISIAQQTGMVDSWLKENLQLIRGVNTAQLTTLRTLFHRASRDGMSRADLVTSIGKVLDSSAKRSTLIASDQTYKLNGQLDRMKQQNAGIERYYWRTAGDARVRPSHRSLSGQLRSWDDDSPHPAQEINCRCHAEPDIEDLFKDSR